MNPKLILATVSLFVITSGCKCKRPGDEVNIGGKGGNVTLNVTTQHHENDLSAMVYIKYNATEEPASYDDSVKTETVNGHPVASFSGLKKGKYYLHGVGWDDEYDELAKGSITFEATEEITYQLYLPISGKHGNP
jgi:hypothetical protein